MQNIFIRMISLDQNKMKSLHLQMTLKMQLAELTRSTVCWVNLIE